MVGHGRAGGFTPFYAAIRLRGIRLTNHAILYMNVIVKKLEQTAEQLREIRRNQPRVTLEQARKQFAQVAKAAQQSRLRFQPSPTCPADSRAD